jgi:hypothetical protein
VCRRNSTSHSGAVRVRRTSRWVWHGSRIAHRPCNGKGSPRPARRHPARRHDVAARLSEPGIVAIRRQYVPIAACVTPCLRANRIRVPRWEPREFHPPSGALTLDVCRRPAPPPGVLNRPAGSIPLREAKNAQDHRHPCAVAIRRPSPDDGTQAADTCPRGSHLIGRSLRHNASRRSALTGAPTRTRT